jgi:hypothetical protein
MALPLPNGETQFIDASGNPLAGGYVYHYIPGTSTPKNTYQDQAGTIVNSNPIVLDAAGRAVIYGDGLYRQVVTDSLGNQAWDQETGVATLSVLGAVAKSGDTMTGRLTVPAFTSTSSVAAETILPIGNPSLLSFNSISGTTTSSTEDEFSLAVNFVSNTGAAATVPTAKNKVALYAAIQADSGSGNVWAFNPLLLINSGACTIGGAQIAEFDLANNSGTHFGDAGGFPAQPAVFGMQISGISTNRATAAVAVLGNLSDLVSPMWNQGLIFAAQSVRLTTIADYTNSATSIDLQGNHTGYGVDFYSGSFASGAIRLDSQARIVARNAADSANFDVLKTSSSDSLMLGASASPYVIATASVGFVPETDNTMSLGVSGSRWAAVWAVNGTIQTSDPREKTDIETLSDVPVGEIIDAIKPITFRWIEGGKDADGNPVPGKRTHWGFNAEEVETIADIAGRDFGGFVKAEDGTLAMRPDQMIPILWEEMRHLRARVAELEGRKS